MRLAKSGVVALLLIAACSQSGLLSDDGMTALSRGTIPAGVYTGELTGTYTSYIGNTLYESGTETEPVTVAFGNDGRPLDVVSGNPEAAGVTGSVEFGNMTCIETTQSVVVAGDAVVVRYVDACSASDGMGTVIEMSGTKTITYTRQTDGTIHAQCVSSMGSDMVSGVWMSYSLEWTATLYPSGSN